MHYLDIYHAVKVKLINFVYVAFYINGEMEIWKATVRIIPKGSMTANR